MLITKIRKLLKDNKERLANISAQNEELEWAHIFNNSIRGVEWMRDLSISPGRWAGNYSFFYVLTRILSDYKPARILEFGLGESSKVISSFITTQTSNSTHLMLEQSAEWIEAFTSKFTLSESSQIVHLPLQEKYINDFVFNGYKGIEDQLSAPFDLYVVDGPFGSDRYSRYDICLAIEHCTGQDEFIITIDDYNRLGEKDTANAILKLMERKGIPSFTGIYKGKKSQIVITTAKYKFATTL